MVDADVYDLRWRVGGLSYAKAAEICGVHRRTISRWEKAGRCPVWFVTLCRAYGGQLDALRDAGPQWQGWTMRNDYLLSPEGIKYSAYEINSIPWLWAMVGDLRSSLRHETAPGSQHVLPFTRHQIG